MKRNAVLFAILLSLLLATHTRVNAQFRKDVPPGSVPQTSTPETAAPPAPSRPTTLARVRDDLSAEINMVRETVYATSQTVSDVDVRLIRMQWVLTAVTLLAFLSIVCCVFLIAQLHFMRKAVMPMNHALVQLTEKVGGLQTQLASTIRYGQSNRDQHIQHDRRKQQPLHEPVEQILPPTPKLEIERERLPRHPTGSHRRRHQDIHSRTEVDQNVLVTVASICLDLPQSVDQFRQLWVDSGGDREVCVEAGDDGEERPVVFYVGTGGDSLWTAVPNTTSWERLSKTRLFRNIGDLGPGSTVAEVIHLAQARRSDRGEFMAKDFGTVRLTI